MYHPVRVLGHNDNSDDKKTDLSKVDKQFIIRLRRNKILIPIMDIYHCFDINLEKSFNPFAAEMPVFVIMIQKNLL